jgi:hypothetical protein
MDRLVLMIGLQGVISLVTKDAKIDLVFSPDPRSEGFRLAGEIGVALSHHRRSVYSSTNQTAQKDTLVTDPVAVTTAMILCDTTICLR